MWSWYLNLTFVSADVYRQNIPSKQTEQQTGQKLFAPTYRGVKKYFLLTLSCKATSPIKYDLRSSNQATARVQPLTSPFNHILVWPCSSKAGKTTCRSNSSRDNSLTGASLKKKSFIFDRFLHAHNLMGESNTIVSAYTLYWHLQLYCSHPSI